MQKFKTGNRQRNGRFLLPSMGSCSFTTNLQISVFNLDLLLQMAKTYISNELVEVGLRSHK